MNITNIISNTITICVVIIIVNIDSYSFLLLSDSGKVFRDEERISLNIKVNLTVVKNLLTIEDYESKSINNFYIKDSILTIDNIKTGWFKVIYYCEEKEEKIKLLSFAVIPTFKKKKFNPYFGIHVRINKSGLEKVKNLGAGSIRLHGHGADILKWSLVEKNKDEYNWNSNSLKPFIENDIKIFATVGQSPSWASSNPKADYLPWKSSYFGPYAHPPKDYINWYNFLEKAYDYYGDAINYWEIWNEPDIHFLVSENKVESYKLLLRSAIKLKQNHSKYKIAAPSVAYFLKKDAFKNNGIFPSNKITNYRDTNFLPTLIQDKLMDSIDVFSFHHYETITDQYEYSEKQYLNYLSKINRLQDRIGDKKIFVSEFNVLSNKPEYSEENDKLISNLLVFQHLQLFSLGIDCIFTYNAFDNNNNAKWNNFFFDGDNPTMTFVAYSVMTNYMSDLEVIKRNYNARNGIITFYLSNENSSLKILFLSSEDLDYQVKNNEKIFNNFGNQININKKIVELKKNNIYYIFNNS